jgi:hypothetical protein
MTNVIADLFVDVYPSNAMLSLFLDSNCFLIASRVSEYSIWQMWLRVMADDRTTLPFIALNDGRSSMYHIAFHGIRAKTF